MVTKDAVRAIEKETMRAISTLLSSSGPAIKLQSTVCCSGDKNDIITMTLELKIEGQRFGGKSHHFVKWESVGIHSFPAFIIRCARMYP